ncbi:MAG: hypothetical protein RI952_1714 [Bacteroidota bacterium]|jgi:DNA-binding NarL/FixJ family response regulator
MDRKIIIYDSVPLMQLAYNALLGENLQCKLTFAANELELENKVSSGDFDLALIDVLQKDRINLSLIKRISRLNKKLNIAVFSAIYDDELKAKALLYGASVVIEKNQNQEQLLKTILLLSDGSRYFDKKMKLNAKLKLVKKKNVSPLLKLSSRELQIAELLVSGASNNTITQQLNLAATTISTYKKRILIKTDTNNILELSELFKQYSKNK